ncbi:MAG: metallophosphoesterase [Planctomycetota bacterium]
MTTRFAAVGDVHGEMDLMVELLREREASHGPFEFVLQVGDLEPHRHEQDLASMAAPAKYRDLGDFPTYHRGERALPWPVCFVGGNHEPYGWLDELPAGGELIENCRYLGRAGVAELGGLRVVGLSGIHRERDYERPRPGPGERCSPKERIGFREGEVEAALAHGRADVLVLHDWPSGIDQGLPTGLRRGAGGFGNEPARLLVELLRPRLVLCGHMHFRHRARVPLRGTGGAAEVCCLAKVSHSPPPGAAREDAVAVFEVRGGRPVELI